MTHDHTGEDDTSDGYKELTMPNIQNVLCNTQLLDRFTTGSSSTQVPLLNI